MGRVNSLLTNRAQVPTEEVEKMVKNGEKNGVLKKWCFKNSAALLVCHLCHIMSTCSIFSILLDESNSISYLVTR